MIMIRKILANSGRRMALLAAFHNYCETAKQRQPRVSTEASVAAQTSGGKRIILSIMRTSAYPISEINGLCCVIAMGKLCGHGHQLVCERLILAAFCVFLYHVIGLQVETKRRVLSNICSFKWFSGSIWPLDGCLLWHMIIFIKSFANLLSLYLDK